MTLLDRNGQLNGRIKAYAILFTVISAMLGWAFTLGIVYGQVQTNTAEIALLRDAGYGMELSEAFCDVVIERWQAFTGKLATPDVDGRAFEEVKAERLAQVE